MNAPELIAAGVIVLLLLAVYGRAGNIERMLQQALKPSVLPEDVTDAYTRGVKDGRDLERRDIEAGR